MSPDTEAHLPAIAATVSGSLRPRARRARFWAQLSHDLVCDCGLLPSLHCPSVPSSLRCVKKVLEIQVFKFPNPKSTHHLGSHKGRTMCSCFLDGEVTTAKGGPGEM